MEINKDFVASVIIKDNGLLEYVEIKIPKRNQHILSKMKDMCENPNRTILDLQEIAASLIISKEEHNVCLPYEYYASYMLQNFQKIFRSRTTQKCAMRKRMNF